MKTLLKLLAALVALLVMFALALVALDRFAPHTAARWAIQMERSRADLAMHAVTLPDGFTIAYNEAGAAGTNPPLLLVHGSGGDKDNFVRIARELKGEHLLIPDLPGYGDSSKPADADYRIPAQVERLAKFLDALGVPKAHLAGNSMGGFIVTAFAAKYPERVASLWLLAPAGLKSAPESEARRIFRTTGRSPLFAEKPEDYTAILDMVMAKPPRVPGSILQTFGERAAGNYALHSRIYRDLWNDPFSLETALAERPLPPALPVRLVWGDADRVLHPGGAAIFQKLIPQAELRMLSNIGHVPQMEAPAAVAGDYLEWRRRQR